MEQIRWRVGGPKYTPSDELVSLTLTRGQWQMIIDAALTTYQGFSTKDIMESPLVHAIASLETDLEYGPVPTGGNS